jgi:hypothetical protein
MLCEDRIWQGFNSSEGKRRHWAFFRQKGIFVEDFLGAA